MSRRRSRRPATSESDVQGYICFSAQDWWYFNRGHSDFQLMTRVAQRHPVLLVNSLGMRMPTRATTSTPWHRIMRKIRSASRGLRRPVADLPNFHVFTPLFLPIYGDGVASRINRNLVAAQVRLAARIVGIGRPAVVVTLPTAWPVARRIPRSRTVVYRSDRYSALPEANGSLVSALERQLLMASDVAFFASSALLEDEQHLARRPVLLSHGIDLQQFQPAECLTPHALLTGVASPRVGYVGMIDDYTIDRGLLARLAEDHPQATIVLAGPVDSDLSTLLEHDNVVHLGVLPFSEVPAVLAGLDVLIMPWQRNEWIRYCNPIKLKEYLAVGRPVVSTDFPEARRLDDVIATAADDGEFSALVGEALAGRGRASPSIRRQAVSKETWDAQTTRLMAFTEQLAELTAPEGGERVWVRGDTPQ